MKIDLRIEEAFYDKTIVVKNFALLIESGEKVCLSGKSGIGKSTVLKIIAGIHKQYRGTVTIANTARIAFMPQNTTLLPWKNVLKNVTILKKNNTSADFNAARELLSRLDLCGYEKRYPGELSGGQRQRAALAQALFYEPDILLLDESFSALDEETKMLALGLLKEIQAGRNMIMLLVSHTRFEAEYLECRSVTL